MMTTIQRQGATKAREIAEEREDISLSGDLNKEWVFDADFNMGDIELFAEDDPSEAQIE
jgi:hypothetical protein